MGGSPSTGELRSSRAGGAVYCNPNARAMLGGLTKRSDADDAWAREGAPVTTPRESSEWSSVTAADGFAAHEAVQRHALADHAKASDWDRVLRELDARPDLVNSWRPGGQAWFTPLHHAARAGAPLDVVGRLMALGAWRTLRTRTGERPLEIALRHHHAHLVGPLEPTLIRAVPADALATLEAHFHAIIRERAADLVEQQALRLPALDVLLELAEPRMWCPVPGMYGGFSFWLERCGSDPVMITESWSRVVDGSGQRHEVTRAGVRVIAEGFV